MNYKNNNIYLIYKHVNKINGKIYVGQTCQNINKRWGKNGIKYKKYTTSKNGIKCYTHFWSAIQKYGWDNFEHKILIHGLTKEQADRWEKKLIKEWNLMNPDFGYNKKEGGEGGAFSEETCLKISESKIGVLNPYYKKIGNNHPRSKNVICLDTGIIYESINIAEKELNIKHISDCCNFKRNFTNGLHFMFYKDYINTKKSDIEKILNIKQIGDSIRGDKNGFSKKVIRIIDKKIYNSIVECINDNNISKSSILRHCKHLVKYPRFMYYNEYI